MSTDPLRRNKLDKMTPAELAITDAISIVEGLGADERLTHAVVALMRARERVADFVDWIPLDGYDIFTHGSEEVVARFLMKQRDPQLAAATQKLNEATHALSEAYRAVTGKKPTDTVGVSPTEMADEIANAYNARRADELKALREQLTETSAAFALLKLLRDGGHIVSSAAVSSEVIAAARGETMMMVDNDGFGYVYRPTPAQFTTVVVPQISNAAMDRRQGFVPRCGPSAPLAIQTGDGRLNLGTPTEPAKTPKKSGTVPMLLWCPSCGARHIDAGEFATKAHHTHACQKCGMVWRPAIVDTVGVEFLPGFRDAR